MNRNYIAQEKMVENLLKDDTLNLKNINNLKDFIEMVKTYEPDTQIIFLNKIEKRTFKNTMSVMKNILAMYNSDKIFIEVKHTKEQFEFAYKMLEESLVA